MSKLSIVLFAQLFLFQALVEATPVPEFITKAIDKIKAPSCQQQLNHESAQMLKSLRQSVADDEDVSKATNFIFQEFERLGLINVALQYVVAESRAAKLALEISHVKVLKESKTVLSEMHLLDSEEAIMYARAAVAQLFVWFPALQTADVLTDEWPKIQSTFRLLGVKGKNDQKRISELGAMWSGVQRYVGGSSHLNLYLSDKFITLIRNEEKGVKKKASVTNSAQLAALSALRPMWGWPKANFVEGEDRFNTQELIAFFELAKRLPEASTNMLFDGFFDENYKYFSLIQLRYLKGSPVLEKNISSFDNDKLQELIDDKEKQLGAAVEVVKLPTVEQVEETVEVAVASAIQEAAGYVPTELDNLHTDLRVLSSTHDKIRGLVSDKTREEIRSETTAILLKRGSEAAQAQAFVAYLKNFFRSNERTISDYRFAVEQCILSSTNWSDKRRIEVFNASVEAFRAVVKEYPSDDYDKMQLHALIQKAFFKNADSWKNKTLSQNPFQIENIERLTNSLYFLNEEELELEIARIQGLIDEGSEP